MEPDLRYPIGKYERVASLTPSQRTACIDAMAEAPSRLAAAVAGLTPAQLDTPYRPGGWSVRQVVHHLPDSHFHAYTRFKFALAENEPAIKAYDEAVWAEMVDAKTAPIEISLTLFDSLQKRWVMFIRSLSPSDLARTYRHPERGVVALEENLALYAWHGRHHVTHITALRERSGW
jgi:hypothetical protein